MYHITRDQILMLKELHDVMTEFLSGSRTTTMGKCQGGDAMLEEVNKETKAWLKMAGIPTDDQWLQVFRNFDELHKLII